MHKMAVSMGMYYYTTSRTYLL